LDTKKDSKLASVARNLRRQNSLLMTHVSSESSEEC